MYLFYVQNAIIAIIMYSATLRLRLSKNIDHWIVGTKVIDYVVAGAPSDFVIYVVISYLWGLIRLRIKRVYVSVLEKTVETNRLKITCFDKTGTLTDN